MKTKAPDRVFYFYFAASLFLLFLIPWAITHAQETNLPPLKPFVRWVINLLFLNLLASYIFLVNQIKKSQRWLSIWQWGGLILIGIGLCALQPVFSGDLREYLIRGRILGIYHLSPYVHTPGEFPLDILFPYSIWLKNPDSYGPLFVFVETIPALIFPSSVIGMVWLEKVLLLVSMIFGIYFFIKTVQEFTAEAKWESIALFAISPLLIVNTVIDGHNDILMLMLTLAAVYFHLKGHFSRSFFCWTLAFLVKYTVVLILPFLVVLAVRAEQKKTGRFPWIFIFREILVNLAVIVLTFWPLWGGMDTFLALIRANEWFYSNTIPYAVHQALGFLGLNPSPLAMKRVFLGGYFLIYCFLLKSCFYKEGEDSFFFRRLCLAYLLFYLTVTIPFGYHYLLWALPWLILSRWPMTRFLVVLYTAVGLFAYFKRMNYLMILGMMGYFVALGFWYFKIGSKERKIV